MAQDDLQISVAAQMAAQQQIGGCAGGLSAQLVRDGAADLVRVVDGGLCSMSASRSAPGRTRKRVGDELGRDVDSGGVDEDDRLLLVELAPDRVEALVADQRIAIWHVRRGASRDAQVVMITKPCGAGSRVKARSISARQPSTSKNDGSEAK